MIEEAKEEHPGMPLSKLCDLFGVSRSWYYEKPSSDEKASEDVALRDAIEHIVLATAGSRRPSSAKGGASTARKCLG